MSLRRPTYFCRLCFELLHQESIPRLTSNSYLVVDLDQVLPIKKRQWQLNVLLRSKQWPLKLKKKRRASVMNRKLAAKRKKMQKDDDKKKRDSALRRKKPKELDKSKKSKHVCNK